MIKKIMLITLINCFAIKSFAHCEYLNRPSQTLNHRYYVCYQKRVLEEAVNNIFSAYYPLQYQGCLISKKHCYRVQKRKYYRQFGYYRTYQQALNAYYRCANS